MITNLVTLVYTFKSFDIKTHVYTLLFIDALISTISNFALFPIQFLRLSPYLEMDPGFCSALFFFLFLPTLYGSILMCLVAIVRLILVTKAAQNIQFPNWTVSAWTLTSFWGFVLLSGSYIITNLMMDQPLSVTVEVCAKLTREPREGTTFA